MASVSSKEVELLKKSRLTFGERAHLTWKRMKDNKVNYFLILPFLIFFLLFTIIPVLSSIVLSFTRYDILNAPVFVGWDNYLRMFLEDEVFLIALKNTFQFAVITGPVSYFLCFVFAWFINDFRLLPERRLPLSSTRRRLQISILFSSIFSAAICMDF